MAWPWPSIMCCPCVCVWVCAWPAVVDHSKQAAHQAGDEVSQVESSSRRHITQTQRDTDTYQHRDGWIECFVSVGRSDLGADLHHHLQARADTSVRCTAHTHTDTHTHSHKTAVATSLCDVNHCGSIGSVRRALQQFDPDYTGYVKTKDLQAGNHTERAEGSGWDMNQSWWRPPCACVRSESARDAQQRPLTNRVS